MENHQQAYILDENKNIVEATFHEARELFKSPEDLIIAEDILDEGHITVQTVFTVFDAYDETEDNHSYPRPLLFTTTVIGGMVDGLVSKSHTYEMALHTHELTIKNIARFNLK
jgi:hypothetical protein